MEVSCRSCSSPVVIGSPTCPECGGNEPTQAWLHLVAGIRFLQDDRFRRAAWELMAAKSLDASLPLLDRYLAEVEQQLSPTTIDEGTRSPERFVDQANQIVEQLPWGPHDWLCRPDIVEAEDLLLVRVHMPPGQAHQFHRHPEMEELIYVLEGQAEQWVDQRKQLLGAGEMAFVPRDVVHGTYNASDQTLRFLAILSPARITGEPLVDVSGEEPWKSLRPVG